MDTPRRRMDPAATGAADMAATTAIDDDVAGAGGAMAT
jgi:hypothetical protein